MGGAAGADRLIRWFLTDLPTLSCHCFPPLELGEAVVKNLAAVLASCRQKEPIKAKTPSRLDGSGAPFSLLSQLLLPKITGGFLQELRGSFSQFPASRR